MNKVELTEQLDRAIESMLRNEALPAATDPQIAELVAIAGELCELPRVDFKARLRNELEEEAAMSTATQPVEKKVTPVREGFRTITPYLVVSDVHAEVEFLTQAFSAEGQIYGLGTQGGFHA